MMVSTIIELEPALNAVRGESTQSFGGLLQALLQVAQVIRDLALGYARALRDFVGGELVGPERIRDALAHGLDCSACWLEGHRRHHP